MLAMLLSLIPLLVWMAFWLFAVNWKKVWPILSEGAWAPVVLLGFLSALVWAQLFPTCRLVPLLPHFWHQLAGVGVVIGAALFSGWLQGLLHYSPVEIAVEPPAHHDHGHGHDHGHHH